MSAVSRLAGLLILIGAIVYYLSVRAASVVPADDPTAPTFTCETAAKVLYGDHVAIKLRQCPSAEITGNGNSVDLDGTASVRIDGDDNIVRWTGERPPAVDDRGKHNTVRAL